MRSPSPASTTAGVGAPRSVKRISEVIVLTLASLSVSTSVGRRSSSRSSASIEFSPFYHSGAGEHVLHHGPDLREGSVDVGACGNRLAAMERPYCRARPPPVASSDGLRLASVPTAGLPQAVGRAGRQRDRAISPVVAAVAAS